MFFFQFYPLMHRLIFHSVKLTEKNLTCIRKVTSKPTSNTICQLPIVSYLLFQTKYLKYVCQLSYRVPLELNSALICWGILHVKVVTTLNIVFIKKIRKVLLHNGGFCNGCNHKTDFCSYELSIHKKTNIMQIMTKNIIIFLYNLLS